MRRVGERFGKSYGVEWLQALVLRVSGQVTARGKLVKVRRLCAARRAVRNTRSSSAQERWRADEGAQEALRGSIRAVLVELFDRHHEVPFIACHRKAVRARALAAPHACKGTP